jgi:hypothetical protein
MKNPLFILLFSLLLSCSSNKATKYEFIGVYNYKITDVNKFNNTYLKEGSLGYVIGDLEFESCGLKIIGIDAVKNQKDDFIITANYPIKEILIYSDKIENEGAGETRQKPLDVILDKKKKTKKIYIYRLEEKGKYRLLVG